MKMPSVTTMLEQFRERHPNKQQSIPVWHFCDNESDANECGKLVLLGEKKATSPSLWGIEQRNEEIPKIGDLDLITNWQGDALAIIQTTSVKIVAFEDISEAYAALEGEGDKSLEYWKKVHWAYYNRELSPFNLAPTLDMPIVCVAFEVIYS